MGEFKSQPESHSGSVKLSLHIAGCCKKKPSVTAWALECIRQHVYTMKSTQLSTKAFTKTFKTTFERLKNLHIYSDPKPEQWIQNGSDIRSFSLCIIRAVTLWMMYEPSERFEETENCSLKSNNYSIICDRWFGAVSKRFIFNNAEMEEFLRWDDPDESDTDLKIWERLICCHGITKCIHQSALCIAEGSGF